MLKNKNDSLVNELKGNIFEFLVAQKISKMFNLESSFLLGVNSSYLKLLKNYEIKLKELSPTIAKKLPMLSQSLADEIKSSLLKKKLTHIFLVGKMEGTKLDLKKFESDLVLIDELNNQIGLSLKLCKSNSFVNTKSAGIKSFLKNYFNEEHFQNELDQVVILAYNEFGNKLYEFYDFGLFDNFKIWREKGLATLPGDLNINEQTLLFNYYHQVSEKLFEIIVKLSKDDPKKFTKRLLPLLGFSDEHIVQGFLFHDENEESKIIINTSDNLLKLKNPKISRQANTSFLISWDKIQLQIRVKPMNEFTQSSMKVNCSVKFVRDR